MKKLFLAAILFVGGFSNVSAEDLLQVAPITVGTNVDLVSEECMLNVVFSTDEVSNLIAAQFDLYIPEQITFDPEYYYEGDAIGIEKRKPTHTINCQAYNSTKQDKEGYTRYLCNVYSMTKKSFIGDNGSTLVSFPIGTGSVAGIYPVYIGTTKLSYSATSYLPVIKMSTTYIKVGEPTEAVELKAIGVIPTAVTSALKDESLISSVNLVDATQINGNLDISNVGITALPEAGIAVEGTTSYTRNLSTQYGTVCVPFELQSTEETQYYALSEMTGNKLTFQPVDVVAAGTPALVKGNISASVNNATLVAPVSGEMVGTYSNVVPGAVGYFIGQDKFWALEPTTKVGSYKAYIPGALGAKSLKIFIEDETGIHEVSSEISSDDIYNLQGMKLNKTQKGINIVGGKKVILK